MNTTNYIEKTKEEIIKILGNPFKSPNYPIHYDLWAFQVKKNWLGKNTILYIEFKNNISVKAYHRKK